jgi:hypothetical protein
MIGAVGARVVERELVEGHIGEHQVAGFQRTGVSRSHDSIRVFAAVT